MLSKKEKKENMNVTIGRLNAEIRRLRSKRAKELFEKIQDDLEKLELDIIWN